MRNRWSGKRRAGNFGDPFRKERQGEEKWEVMRQVSPCFLSCKAANDSYG